MTSPQRPRAAATPTAREGVPFGHESLEENHERIWLSPRCAEERYWCQDDQGPCDECDEPSVKYVRADIAEAALLAARQEIERLTGERVGWKLVPVTPTEAMYEGRGQSGSTFSAYLPFRDFAWCYASMLAAAPAAESALAPPQAQRRDEVVEALADDEELAVAFHQELRKQGAFSIEHYGKVALAMYPFLKLVAAALTPEPK